MKCETADAQQDPAGEAFIDSADERAVPTVREARERRAGDSSVAAVPDLPQGPVDVFVLGCKGLVWSCADARFLRETCRLTGSMLGGLSKYRQQSGLHGLPLELCMEEVALTAHKGWARLLEMPNTESIRDREGEMAVDWKAKVSEKTGRIAIPLVPDSAAPLASWEFPSTSNDRLRCAVFRDLHAQGLWLTSGTKFGSDFLAYPGDPTMYHAQYTVRVEEWTHPLPTMTMAASGRASHAARKHMLLSSVALDEDDPALHWTELPVLHVCVAPEAGFGKAA